MVENKVQLQCNLDFLRFCLHEGMSLPESVKDIDWSDLYTFGEEQSIIGVLFHGIKRLKKDDPHPSARELARWGLANTQIIDDNRKAYADAFKAIDTVYRKYGHRSCVLKGQGNALMYPNPYMRTSGDIDLWVAPNKDEDIDDIKRLCKYIDPTCKLEYHHADINKLILGLDTEIELHYRPSFDERLYFNHRLQRYFVNETPRMFDKVVALPDRLGKICLPTDSFNRIFQMSHLMKHFLSEGIGLRQIIDYYYLLRKGFNTSDKDEYNKLLDELGLKRFAKGVMYILDNYLGLEKEYIPLKPDARMGRFIMGEIIKTGNFGFYDTRYDSISKPSNALSNAVYSIIRVSRLIRHFPLVPLSHAIWIVGWHFHIIK